MNCSSRGNVINSNVVVVVVVVVYVVVVVVVTAAAAVAVAVIAIIMGENISGIDTSNTQQKRKKTVAALAHTTCYSYHFERGPAKCKKSI